MAAQLDWRFLACVSEDDTYVLNKIGWLVTSWLPGPWSVQLQFGSSAGILSPCQWHLTSEEYWDSSSEAGPATRAAAPFDEPRPELEVLAVDNGKLVFHGLQW